MAKKHNPFAMFRRNQKAWLAGLTLFTMFSFIVLGSLMQCVQSGAQRSQGAVITYATTKKFGPIDQYTYAKYRSDINQLNEFLMAATQYLMEKKVILNYGEMLLVMEPDPNDSSKKIPILLDNLTALIQQLNYLSLDSQALIEHWLATKVAASQKYKADQNGVRQYLNVLFQDNLTPEGLTFAMSRAGLNEYFLTELLKNQIIYERLIRSLDGGRRSVSFFEQALPFGHGNILTAPGETFDSYEKLHRKIRADVAVFKAEDYVDQIADPSEKTLKYFFEKYKNLPYSQYSELPGFYQPTKAAFQVIRANLSEDRINAVSMDEVKAYYEANKEEFKKPDLSGQSSADNSLALPFDDASLFGNGLTDPISLQPATEEAVPAQPATEETA
ncbi:MAG: hypothetical protein Q4C95_12625, partial [Planctomycetia bacterium]|nr:hypothetical protein [Planctomycetia bacterium]